MTSPYKEASYDSWKRYSSYFYQFDTVTKLEPCNILEIGVGSNFLNERLRNFGYDVTTCDIDAALQPDVVGDIRDLPFEDNSFDCVTCFEVLEHIPFESFRNSLEELHRVSRKHVVFSIPYITFNIYAYFQLLPRTRSKFFFWRVFERSSKVHEFDGHHYWEMGKKNYSRTMIQVIINDVGFEIIDEFTPFVHYQYFFVLRKR